MKKILALTIGLFVSTAMAQDVGSENVTFSKFNSALKLASYDKQRNMHTFIGKIKLTGTLFVSFDMAGPNQAGGHIIAKKFVPDEKFNSQLPAVTHGFYPGPVRYINLVASREQIAGVFGGSEVFERLSHGSDREINVLTEVVLDKFIAAVECDARVYVGNVVSIGPLVESKRVAGLEHAPHGC